MSNMPRIGIIGIGAMGLAIARNLHHKAYGLLVWPEF